jgi:hypothetical protein
MTTAVDALGAWRLARNVSVPQVVLTDKEVATKKHHCQAITLSDDPPLGCEMIGT